VTNIQRDRDTDNATSSYYYIPLFLLGAINKLKFYLQFKQWERRIPQTLHEDFHSCLKMVLEVRVRQTVAFENELQGEFSIDKHLVQMVAMVGRVVRLWQLTRKHLHLPTAMSTTVNQHLQIIHLHTHTHLTALFPGLPG